MCLGIPGEIIDIDEETAAAHRARSTSAASPATSASTTIPDAVVGDYVLVHVGFALSKVDADEAERRTAPWRSWGSSRS